MRSSKALEMINNGQIEALKKILEDEIYTESLKGKSDAKKRYTAMKKYFTYVSSVREACQKPCILDYEGKQYTSFCNSYSLVLTTENCGELDLFNTDTGTYPDVTRLIHRNGTEETIDFADVFARAKSKGYKLKKSEVVGNGYMMLYNGSYFRLGLVEATYGIINDGKEATVYHVEGGFKPLVVENDIGIAVIMPMRYESEPDDGVVIIKV